MIGIDTEGEMWHNIRRWLQDAGYKARCLLATLRIRNARRGLGPLFWFRVVLPANLDNHLCCNGRECHCGGTTEYDQINYVLFPEKYE